ncbi:MAG TPA: histidinol-phosphatase [Alphaproteobacteria bacterium]|jgi:inositol-phosphate phosphatase/L-galactose 1-phosphate phosphatase/histidinol-phosphatase|nr:histidinol-phosphatase [Alphaproteobacteria bacterium]
MTTPCPDEFVAFAHRLADAAGAVARRYFRTPVAVDTKADQSPVTIADREAESAMRALIAERYPAHGVLGEEHGASDTGADHVWVLDPIDGTKSFISGIPLFGVLIALLREGRPILGIIEQPISRERWLGRAGAPSTLNGAPVKTRACPALDQAALFATTPEMFQGADAEAFERLKRRVRLVRHGADCYAAGLLAMGFIDLMVESTLKPYDYCALVPVIEGAGGTITDWAGRPLGLDSDGRIAAAGDARAHKAALEALAG